MKTKKEIQEKLTEAEQKLQSQSTIEQDCLAAVVITLRWVLGINIILEPKDPTDVDPAN